MLITVTGGSGSGKSEFAEKTAVSLSGKGKPSAGSLKAEEKGDSCGELVYLATMAPLGSEAQERIQRHLRLREGKGFVTIEKSSGLALLDPEEIRGKTVLLEDLSNLVSGEMFLPDGSRRMPEEVIHRVLEGIRFLLADAENLVIVMNEIFSDGRTYGDSTEDFIRTLGYLNRKLALRADEAYEVVYGIPVRLRQQ